MNYEDDQEGLFLRNLEGLAIDTFAMCLTGEVDRAELVALPGLLRELREYRLLNELLCLQRETSCTCHEAFHKPRGTSRSLPLGQDLLKSLDQKLSARLHEIYQSEEPHGDVLDRSSGITSSQEQSISEVPDVSMDRLFVSGGDAPIEDPVFYEVLQDMHSEALDRGEQ